MKKDYWKNEPDAEIDFGFNSMRYYRTAGVLQVMRTYEKNGKKGVARCIALNLDALRESPEAMELMQQIFADIAV